MNFLMYITSKAPFTNRKRRKLAGDKMSSVSSKKSHADESERILEIKKKIQDEKYLDGAIYRIAMILSRKLMEEDEVFERK